MAATLPLARAMATTMKKNMAWLMTPMQAWVSRPMRPATQTSTNPIRKWKNIMTTWGQARLQMVA